MKHSMVVVLTMVPLMALLSTQPASAKYEYGNWCGPYHPAKPSENPEPIDAIDEACRKHDQAYAAGQPYGVADAELSRELVNLMQSGNLNDRQFASAAVIATYMTGQQNVTVFRDVVDGKLSSVLLVTIATSQFAVTMPTSVTTRLLDEVADKLGGQGGKLIKVVIKPLAELPSDVIKVTGRLATKLQKELSRFFRRLKSWF